MSALDLVAWMGVGLVGLFCLALVVVVFVVSWIAGLFLLGVIVLGIGGGLSAGYLLETTR